MCECLWGRWIMSFPAWCKTRWFWYGMGSWMALLLCICYYFDCANLLRDNIANSILPLNCLNLQLSILKCVYYKLLCKTHRCAMWIKCKQQSQKLQSLTFENVYIFIYHFWYSDHLFDKKTKFLDFQISKIIKNSIL